MKRTQYPSEANEFKLKDLEFSAATESKAESDRDFSLFNFALFFLSGRTGGASGSGTTSGTLAGGTAFGLKSFLLANNRLSNFFNTGVIKFKEPNVAPLRYIPP